MTSDQLICTVLVAAAALFFSFNMYKNYNTSQCRMEGIKNKMTAEEIQRVCR